MAAAGAAMRWASDERYYHFPYPDPIDPADIDMEKLLSKIAFWDNHWEWRGEFGRGGYGRFPVNGVKRAAHRVVYTALVGPIPNLKHLDHLCFKRWCVQPRCLEPVDPWENNRRARENKRFERRLDALIAKESARYKQAVA
jgi:hypothetical protein